MTKFIKKPIEIEAIQFGGTAESAVKVFELFDIPDSKFIPNLSNLEEGTIEIKTLEGVMRASKNDFIIKGVEGEFYPCKPIIFMATYDIAE